MPSLQQHSLRKMKFQIVFSALVFGFLISNSNGVDRVIWIAGESGVHPEHPGKCWSQSLSRELSIGEEFSDQTKCELIRCSPTLRFSRRM